MQEIIGKDLAGWRIELWYELRLSQDEIGGKYEVAGYFNDKNLASASGKGKAWYGADGYVVEVSALTKDGVSGYLVANNPKITLSDEETIMAEAITKAKGKLTIEERRLLKLE